jgi:hypothetical protein
MNITSFFALGNQPQIWCRCNPTGNDSATAEKSENNIFQQLNSHLTSIDNQVAIFESSSDKAIS